MRGYKFAVRWIADNDEGSEMELEEIQKLVTVALVADIFEKTEEEVGKAVLKARLEME